MTNNPLISILMPVKNAEAWLVECLESILHQHFTQWELIAINDHSTDQSARVLKSYQSADPRIRWYNNEGSGILPALRMAQSLSNGALLTRMDADDVMPLHKLGTLYDVLQQPGCNIATGCVRYFSDQPISEGYKAYEHWLNQRCSLADHWDWIYRECVIASANWLCKKEHVDFKSNAYPEDYRLVFHWYELGCRVASSEKVTHEWREHAQRTSRNSEHYQQRAFFRMKVAQFLQLDRDAGRPLVVLGSNKKSKLLKAMLEGHDTVYLDKQEVDRLGELGNPQVLVAVFPTDGDRSRLEALLRHHDLAMGADWWYC